MGKRISKTDRVLTYLLEHKTITSNEAWKLYGVTRLSAIIHELRHRRGYRIDTYTIHPTDRFGNVCNCGEYHLIEEE